MKRIIPIVIFITLEIIIITGIIFLGKKLFEIKDKNELSKYVTVIRKENIIFSSDSGSLKYFYEPKPNNIEIIHPSWLGNEVKYNINLDGLNENKNYTINKPFDTYRIITIGDSFTFGQYVNTEENYTEVLEKILNNNLKCKNINNFEIINLGVPGYDIEYTVHRFEKRGIKYSPDLVIWLLNDVKFKKINEYLQPLINKLMKQNYLHSDFNKLSIANNEINQTIDKYLNNMGDDYILKYINNKFDRIPTIYNGNLLILSPLGMKKSYQKLINNFILSHANFQYFDELINVSLYKKYKLLDGHPNVEGHKKIAEDIFKYLQTNYFSDCTVKPDSPD